MLKTKKTFALTASALAVGFAGSAMAQTNLSATTVTPETFAWRSPRSSLCRFAGPGS